MRLAGIAVAFVSVVGLGIGLARAADVPAAAVAVEGPCKTWEVAQAALTKLPGAGGFLGTMNDGWEPFAATPVVAGPAAVLVRRCSKR